MPKEELVTVNDYIKTIEPTKKEAFEKLRAIILKNLPKGFEECINYKMPSYVVPNKLYPKGYHCDTSLPLPFLSIAAQKNFIAFYHMGIYADKKLSDWFIEEYPKHSKSKLDMGKSCIRFKKSDDIPFKLIEQLVKKISPKDWIALYEKAFNK